MLVRALIVLLACMNIGVGVWWAVHREPLVRMLPATEPGVASLTLLSESEQRPIADAAEMASDPESLAPDSACMSIGPFSTPADLRRAMNALLPSAERIQFREVAAVALRGYRVFLPAAGNREQALQTARALSARGVTDYYVVTAGEQQNTISLGIFHALENATNRHDALAALGYNPTVEARTEQAPQWWIDLAVPKDFNWRALVADPAVRAEPKACSSP